LLPDSKYLKNTFFFIFVDLYNKERFPGVVYRTKSPKTAALIFGSGKIVCTGAKSIADVYTGLTKVFDKIREMGIQIVDKPEIKIQNIVASANLGRCSTSMR